MQEVFDLFGIKSTCGKISFLLLCTIIVIIIGGLCILILALAPKQKDNPGNYTENPRDYSNINPVTEKVKTYVINFGISNNKEIKLTHVDCNQISFQPISERDYEKYPWIVRLFNANAPRNDAYCSGLLISPDTVMTSCQCLPNNIMIKMTIGGTKHKKFQDATTLVPVNYINVNNGLCHIKLSQQLIATATINKICANIQG